MTNSKHDDEIDLKELFRTLLRYKVSIILITFIFLIISSVLAYYKPDIYSTSTTIELVKETGPNLGSTDFMLKAFGGNDTSSGDDIALISSRFTVQKALESLNLTTSYYSYNSLNKQTELYKDSPFIVSNKHLEGVMYSKTFELIPLGDDKFNLIIKPESIFSIKSLLKKMGILNTKNDITYNQVHKYGEEINTAWFTFTINKISHTKASNYSFNFIHSDFLFDKYIGGLSIYNVPQSISILRLAYQDTVSLRAKEIINAIAQTFIYQGIQQKTKVAELTLGFIDTQLNSINTELKSSASNLEKYKVKHDVINLGGKVTLTSAKLIEYETQESEIQTEINILNNLKHFIDKNEDLSGLTIGTISFSDETLGNMIVSLQLMTSKKSNMLIDYTEIHPDIQKLTQNIASIKRSIKSALNSNRNQLIQRRYDLRKLIIKFTKSLEALPSQEKELASLARPLNVNQEIYEFLLQKKAETAILKSSTISSARILDTARNQVVPIEPNRKATIMIGFMIGLIIGIVLAFLREFLSYTIQNAEEVERITDIPIYGVVPQNKDDMTENMFYEAFRSIRTNLKFLPGNEKNQIIAITSSVSGEGKTTITAALAEILARGDKKVIMLDLDLRKESLHKEFNLKNNIGISSYLTLQNTLEEVIQETNVHGLEMIATGLLPPNPSELILSSMFTDLLDKLRTTYDYIVIDTPPAGLVTDAIIIMNYSDISFAVLRAQYTRKEFVKNIDRLSREHSNNKMGIILNGTQIGKEYGYGYGASYAQGYDNTQYYKNRT